MNMNWKNELSYKRTHLWVLENETRTHFAVWGEIAFSFLQNFTVKYLENGSQGLSEYIWIETMRKNTPVSFLNQYFCAKYAFCVAKQSFCQTLRHTGKKK